MKTLNVDWSRVFRIKRRNNTIIIRFVDNGSLYKTYDSSAECDEACETLIADAKANRLNITIEGHGELVYDG